MLLRSDQPAVCKDAQSHSVVLALKLACGMTQTIKTGQVMHAWQVQSPAAACTWLLVDRQNLSLSPATMPMPCAGYMSVVFFSTSLPGNPVYSVDLRTLQEVSLQASLQLPTLVA